MLAEGHEFVATAFLLHLLILPRMVKALQPQMLDPHMFFQTRLGSEALLTTTNPDVPAGTLFARAEIDLSANKLLLLLVRGLDMYVQIAFPCEATTTARVLTLELLPRGEGTVLDLHMCCQGALGRADLEADGTSWRVNSLDMMLVVGVGVEAELLVWLGWRGTIVAKVFPAYMLSDLMCFQLGDRGEGLATFFYSTSELIVGGLVTPVGIFVEVHLLHVSLEGFHLPKDLSTAYFLTLEIFLFLVCRNMAFQTCGCCEGLSTLHILSIILCA